MPAKNQNGQNKNRGSMEPDVSRVLTYKNIGNQSTTMVRPCSKNARTQVAKNNAGVGATMEKAKGRPEEEEEEVVD